MSTSVTVRVPATSANIGPGFDCLGVALDLWGEITVTLGGGPADDPMATMARTAARRTFERAGLKVPDITAHYEGDVPLARGLGASAVARVGGLVAANRLVGDSLGQNELLSLATDLERHPDNAAPAIFGGLQVSVVEEDDTIHRTSAAVPDSLQAVLLVPDLRIATKDARRVLPDRLKRGDAVFNTGRAAMLIAALAASRFDLLDAATRDRIHQPYRSTIYPAMQPLFDSAMAAGAHAVYLSGSGSTICALATERMDAIGAAMLRTAGDHGLAAETVVTRPTKRGAEVVSES